MFLLKKSFLFLYYEIIKKLMKRNLVISTKMYSLFDKEEREKKILKTIR
jgi:hypothetical protein